jgi:hypothetical protein
MECLEDHLFLPQGGYVRIEASSRHFVLLLSLFFCTQTQFHIQALTIGGTTPKEHATPSRKIR